MLPSFAKDTVTVLRAPVVKDHGADVPDWSNPTLVTVTGCSVQPGATGEDNQNRAGASIAYTVYMPPGTDVRFTDRVRLATGDYVVVGEPERWTSPTGRLSHVRVELQRWAD